MSNHIQYPWEQVFPSISLPSSLSIKLFQRGPQSKWISIGKDQSQYSCHVTNLESSNLVHGKLTHLAKSKYYGSLLSHWSTSCQCWYQDNIWDFFYAKTNTFIIKWCFPSSEYDADWLLYIFSSILCPDPGKQTCSTPLNPGVYGGSTQEVVIPEMPGIFHYFFGTLYMELETRGVDTTTCVFIRANMIRPSNHLQIDEPTGGAGKHSWLFGLLIIYSLTYLILNWYFKF